MKYLCLVYLDEKRLDELPDEDCVDFDTGIRKSGQCLASEARQWPLFRTAVSNATQSSSGSSSSLFSSR